MLTSSKSSAAGANCEAYALRAFSSGAPSYSTDRQPSLPSRPAGAACRLTATVKAVGLAYRLPAAGIFGCVGTKALRVWLPLLPCHHTAAYCLTVSVKAPCRKFALSLVSRLDMRFPLSAAAT